MNMKEDDESGAATIGRMNKWRVVFADMAVAMTVAVVCRSGDRSETKVHGSWCGVS